MRRASSNKGFTIVELLIVVVVIAILAAITIVSYNGVTQRARTAVLQNDISQVDKKLTTHAIQNADMYPSTLTSIGVVDTDTTTYSYAFNNTSSPTGFCVSVTSNGVSYYVARSYSYGSGPTLLEKPSPTEGVCPEGDAVIPTITNYATNPSAELSVTDYSSPNGSTRAISTVRAYSGTSSIFVTVPGGQIIGNVGVRVINIPSYVAAGMKPNTAYTVTAYTYVEPGQGPVQLSVSGNGRVSPPLNPVSRFNNTTGSWVRIQNGFTTTPSDGTIQIFVMNDATTPSGGSQFWADAFMLTEGTDAPAYADGTTAGWTWNGTPHAASSTGPAQ